MQIHNRESLYQLIQEKIRDFHSIKKNRPFRIAVAGAGGKSTTTALLTLFLAKEGWNVCASTTTKMGYEALNLNGIIPIWVEACDNRHVRGPQNGEEWHKLEAGREVVVLEADGAKCHPFKFPREGEPVCPVTMDLFLISFSAEAIGGITREVCFRQEEAKKVLQSHFEDNLTPSFAARLLYAGYAKCQREHTSSDLVWMATHCDTESACQSARQVLECLESLDSQEAVRFGERHYAAVYYSKDCRQALPTHI